MFHDSIPELKIANTKQGNGVNNNNESCLLLPLLHSSYKSTDAVPRLQDQMGSFYVNCNIAAVC